MLAYSSRVGDHRTGAFFCSLSCFTAPAQMSNVDVGLGLGRDKERIWGCLRVRGGSYLSRVSSLSVGGARPGGASSPCSAASKCSHSFGVWQAQSQLEAREVVINVGLVL